MLHHVVRNNRYTICQQYLATAARLQLPNPAAEAELLSQWGSYTPAAAESQCVVQHPVEDSTTLASGTADEDDDAAAIRVPTASILATIVANALWEDVAYRRNVPRLLCQLAHQHEAVDITDVHECLRLAQHGVDFDDLSIDVPHAKK